MDKKSNAHLSGIGLGLRREFLFELAALEEKLPGIDFLELAPENWIGIGGSRKAALDQLAEKYPLVCHGLSLSIGSQAPLDFKFIDQIAAFLEQYQIELYSEHLSYCSDEQGQLYDLLPLPFTEEAVGYVANRIRTLQQRLGRRVAFENISYYCAPFQAMSEAEFINAALEQADCDLLLDVNNIYVNSVNHGYNAKDFLMSMPIERVKYLHVAGHVVLAEGLLLDTHGAEIDAPVWDLLRATYQHLGVTPTVLERDNHAPKLDEVLAETKRMKMYQKDFLACPA